MTREQKTRKAQGERLRQARIAAGYRSAREAAVENRWAESTYAAHERGSRTIGQDDAERYARRFRAAGIEVTAPYILFGGEEPEEPDRRNAVPIMGYVGAGAVVEPEFEQVPEEGFETVEVPFAVPDEIIGLEVKGDSMRPRYDDGDVLLVWREQRRRTESFVGEEAAVRTLDGRRLLKEIQDGGRRGVYDLYSHNARLIKGVRLEWVGEIYITVRAGQIRRAERARRASATRRSNARAAETEGMDELPLEGRRKRA